jgi:GTP diphosphokinase / guanosine-3',5'-bis(diphosphate) 3'-diphosphatase
MNDDKINGVCATSFKIVFGALRFSAEKHKLQRRKGTAGIPYINHPIEVACLILDQLESPSEDLLVAALLHDTLEDTATNEEEIEILFGRNVLAIVEEVTDDMRLSSADRKKYQILKAGTLSFEARCIKIADKTCNINDMLFTRIHWTRRRKIAYIQWSIKVINQIRSTHPRLIEAFDSMVKQAEGLLGYRFL